MALKTSLRYSATLCDLCVKNPNPPPPPNPPAIKKMLELPNYAKLKGLFAWLAYLTLSNLAGFAGPLLMRCKCMSWSFPLIAASIRSRLS